MPPRPSMRPSTSCRGRTSRRGHLMTTLKAGMCQRRKSMPTRTTARALSIRRPINFLIGCSIAVSFRATRSPPTSWRFTLSTAISPPRSERSSTMRRRRASPWRSHNMRPISSSGSTASSTRPRPFTRHIRETGEERGASASSISNVASASTRGPRTM